MSREAFVDGPIKVSMSSGVVRMTMGELEHDPDNTDKNKKRLNEKIKLFMPLEGFLRTYGAMTGVLKQLEEDGVLKKVKEQMEKSKTLQDDQAD